MYSKKQKLLKKANLKSCSKIPHTTHSKHLVRNGVHKWYFIENISLRWLFTNLKKHTNKINIYITKSLKNFFWRHFSSFVAFEIFFMSQKHFFYLLQEKVLCYTQFKIYSTLKIYVDQIYKFLSIFVLKWSKIYIFHKCEKKIIKLFSAQRRT